MQGRTRTRTISIILAAMALGAAAGALPLLTASRADAPVSSVAATRVGPRFPVDDDAAFFADLRAERRADAFAREQRKTWYEAVRGPTVEQVLVFFNVLLSTAPHDATFTPPDPPPAFTAAMVVETAPPPAAPFTRAAAPPPTATPIPPAPPPPAAAATSGVWTDAAFTQAVWNGVNARRVQAGLAAVSSEPRLARAASDYAIAMSAADWFSHTGPDGSSFVDRIVAAGFPFEGRVGEILAMGTNGWPADDVVQAWMDSTGHREQILTPGYHRAGLACAFTGDDGALTVRCAMEFAE